jgi:cytochrome c biogenesis protein CcmG, thiol:disulfide interchange protein DsbE
MRWVGTASETCCRKRSASFTTAGLGGRLTPTPPTLRAAALLLGLVLAGCGGGGEAGDDRVSSPLADCTGLTEPLGDPVPAAGGEPLPELALPCFTGGEPFRLPELRGPAIVNLWASWCGPCREELPVLQRYADRAGGEAHVLGVVTEDRPAAAASLAEDLGITFPALDDPDGLVRAELAAVGLPVTLFVDPAGQVRYVHLGVPLDERALAELVTEHFGVPS